MLYMRKFRKFGIPLNVLQTRRFPNMIPGAEILPRRKTALSIDPLMIFFIILSLLRRT